MWAGFKVLSLGAKAAVIGSILAVLLAILGTSYYVGYNKGHTESKLAISQYEGKVKDLTIKLGQAEGKVRVDTVTKYLQGETVAGETVYKTRTVVETKVVPQHVLSKGWIYTYNQSVAGAEVDPNLAADPTPSGVVDRDALLTIVDNNATSLANARQLDALIGYENDLERARENAINGKPGSSVGVQ